MWHLTVLGLLSSHYTPTMYYFGPKKDPGMVSDVDDNRIVKKKPRVYSSSF